MAEYVTSDQHYNHRKIIHYCNRPFSDTREMDRYMLKQWNDTVNSDDTVYHLGDFCIGGYVKSKEYWDRLKGYVRLVRGNHDGTMARVRRIFRDACDSMVYSRDGKNLLFVHDPKDGFKWLSDNPGINIDAIVHGHQHNATPALRVENGVTCINVSVEHWDYKPIPIEKILEMI